MVDGTMKRKASCSWALLLALAVAGGCASPQFKRIDADRDVYESWPIEVRQAVLDGKVEKGMTPEMVRMAIGKPTEIVSTSTVPGGEEIWIYRTGGYEDNSAMASPYPYPGGPYPGGPYPSGGMGGGPMIGVGGPSIGISTGRGGTSIGTSMGTGIGIGTGMGGIGIGGGGMGTGVMSPMPMPAAPTVEREVVFRDGVVFRADNPETK
jgi:hypothetical protein